MSSIVRHKFAIAAALIASPLTPLEHLLRHVLNGLHSFGLPWAWAIVALTIIVRMLLVRLTVKQIHSMQSLQIELIRCLDGNETHVLPFHCLGNRFRIAVVVLVGLYERSHKLRWNLPCLVSLFPQSSPQKVRSHSGLHPNQ